MPTKEAKASGGTRTCWPECRMHPKPPEPPDWPGTRVTTPVNTRPGEAAGNQEGHGLGIYPQGSADTATPAGRNLGPWLLDSLQKPSTHPEKGQAPEGPHHLPFISSEGTSPQADVPNQKGGKLAFQPFRGNAQRASNATWAT